MDSELISKMAELLLRADLMLAVEGYPNTSPLRKEIDSTIREYDKQAARYARELG